MFTDDVSFPLFCVAYQRKNATYTVGNFMTKKEYLHVVKTTTTVDEGITA